MISWLSSSTAAISTKQQVAISNPSKWILKTTTFRRKSLNVRQRLSKNEPRSRQEKAMQLLCVLRTPRKASTRLLQLCVLFFGCALAAFGQEATIVGTITDLTGAVVPSAVVTLTNLERGTSRTTVTN